MWRWVTRRVGTRWASFGGFGGCVEVVVGGRTRCASVEVVVEVGDAGGIMWGCGTHSDASSDGGGRVQRSRGHGYCMGVWDALSVVVEVAVGVGDVGGIV